MSKGRRRSPKKTTHAQLPADPVDQLIEEFGRSLLGAVDGADPHQVEAVGSSIIETMRAAGGDSGAWVALVDRCGVLATPPAHAVVLITAVLAPDPRVRSHAAEVAAQLSDRLGHPAWAAPLGRAELVRSWQLTDVFGDQAMVVTEFSRGPLLSAVPHHALIFLLDHNGPGSFVKDITLTDDVPEAEAEIEATLDDLTRIEEVPREQVRALLEPALAATVSAGEGEFYDEPAEDVGHLHLLAEARLRTLPDAALPAPAPLTDEALAELVDSFVASPHAATTGASRDAIRRWAEVIARYVNEYDGGRPLRVSPGKTLNLLLENDDVAEGDVEAWGSVLAAWNSWAAERTELPDGAVAALEEATDEMLEDVLGLAPAVEIPLPDVSTRRAPTPSADDDALRREFAMPHRDAVIDGAHYSDLDPEDPDDLHLLILGEHPEYHRTLSDPSSEELVDGVNPRLHLTMLQVVITRLWQNEPKKTWREAKKLLATGIDRTQVLDALVEPVAQEVFEALSPELGLMAQQPASHRSGRVSVMARDGRPAASDGGDVAFQVRVDIDGATPPIWRRLMLPGSMTLSELHLALQLAFDWTDSHLHHFHDGARFYSQPGQLDDVEDESAVRVADLLRRPGDRLDYEYDLGDSWQHRIVVEKVAPSAERVVRCLGGRRAAPPEDCGGIYRYTELADAWSDSYSPMHEEAREELDGDLAAFHAESVDDRLRRVPVS